MHNLIRRILVLLRASPTWLVAGATVLAIVAQSLVAELPWLPEGTAATVTAWLLTAAGALTAAALVVRRVTPVLEGARGLLPVDEPTTSDAAFWRAEYERLHDLSMPWTPTTASRTGIANTVTQVTPPP